MHVAQTGALIAGAAVGLVLLGPLAPVALIGTYVVCTYLRIDTDT
jgi:hypothetical protein